MQDAVIHRLEIIGEAVKHIPLEERQQHPDIPWRNITGMRDVLVHEYFGVNVIRIWTILDKDLFALQAAVQSLFFKRTEFQGAQDNQREQQLAIVHLQCKIARY